MCQTHIIHETISRTERKMVFDIDYIYDKTINPWVMIEKVINECKNIILEYYETDISLLGEKCSIEQRVRLSKSMSAVIFPIAGAILNP